MEPLEKKIRLFRKMKELASQQQSCLEEDRLDDYFKLARQRDQLRSQIAMDERAAGHPSAEKRKGVNPTAGKEAMEMVEIIRLIRQIDAGIRETLIRKKESLSLEIREMRKGRTAMKGYRNQPQKNAKFIDRNG
ncbi:MAG: hypothetical protein C4576_24125 [Desulfobacteraceae bacterium]|nr:MAG: hypothetical protein C4576_24125 [Desulfobacteraceae bacterium]